MRTETILLAAATLVSLSSLLFIPKKYRLQAQFVFTFVQFPTWVLGLIAVELRLLEYPYRELSRVNRTSFIFEYMILPVLCIHFNAHFRHHASRPKKLGYYLGTASIITAVEFVIERYSMVLRYTGWQWYMTFLGVWLVLWLSKASARWFLGKANPE